MVWGYWDVSVIRCAAMGTDNCLRLDMYVADEQTVIVPKCIVCLAPPLYYEQYTPDNEPPF